MGVLDRLDHRGGDPGSIVWVRPGSVERWFHLAGSKTVFGGGLDRPRPPGGGGPGPTAGWVRTRPAAGWVWLGGSPPGARNSASVCARRATSNYLRPSGCPRCTTRHVALGAKLADFGGWQMPLEYAGGGVLTEHTAVREAVGVFDVSHLGKARGAPGRERRSSSTRCLTNDLGRIAPGQAQYTLCCDDARRRASTTSSPTCIARRPRLPGPQRGQHRRGGAPAARRPRRPA